MKHALLAILITTSVAAQTDRRWTLLPDSMAMIPFEDVREAAALRLTSDEMRRSAVLEVIALNGENDRLRKAMTAQTASYLTTTKALETCAKEHAAITRERDRYARKARRRGVVVAVAVSVAIALILTQ